MSIRVPIFMGGGYLLTTYNTAHAPRTIKTPTDPAEPRYAVFTVDWGIRVFTVRGTQSTLGTLGFMKPRVPRVDCVPRTVNTRIPQSTVNTAYRGSAGSVGVFMVLGAWAVL